MLYLQTPNKHFQQSVIRNSLYINNDSFHRKGTTISQTNQFDFAKTIGEMSPLSQYISKKLFTKQLLILLIIVLHTLTIRKNSVMVDKIQRE